MVSQYYTVPKYTSEAFTEFFIAPFLFLRKLLTSSEGQQKRRENRFKKVVAVDDLF